MLSTCQSAYYPMAPRRTQEEIMEEERLQKYVCPASMHGQERSEEANISYPVYDEEEYSIHLSECGSRSKRAERYCNGHDDECSEANTYSTYILTANESWSDPAIRWGQNRHDGISPAAQPSRLPSLHSRCSPHSPAIQSRLAPRAVSKDAPYCSYGSCSTAPTRPSRVPSAHSTRWSSTMPSRAAQSGLPPRIPSHDSSCARPSRMPSVHSSYTHATSPPSMPARAPTVHSPSAYVEDDDESASNCPTFYEGSLCSGDASTVNGLSSSLFASHEVGSCKRSSEPLLEIAPGVRLHLRCSQETLEAIRDDFYVPTVCFGCNLDLFSIQDAKYCICPYCKIVSPLEPAANDDDNQQYHGIGLGFTADTLMDAQSDMIAGRR